MQLIAAQVSHAALAGNDPDIWQVGEGPVGPVGEDLPGLGMAAVVFLGLEGLERMLLTPNALAVHVWMGAVPLRRAAAGQLPADQSRLSRRHDGYITDHLPRAYRLSGLLGYRTVCGELRLSRHAALHIRAGATERGS